jgi:hypothetical protein
MTSDDTNRETIGATRSITRPRSVLVLALLLSLPWLWFSTSTVDFDGSALLSGFHTGGWFILGFPTAMMLGGVVGLVCCAVARRTNKGVGLGIAVVLSGILTVTAINGKRPSSRLPQILGDLNWDQIPIHRFIIRDSFNDGETTEGILGVSPQSFATITTQMGLNAVENQPADVVARLEASAEPVTGTLWSNRTTRVFYDDATERLYFSHHPRSAADTPMLGR